MNWSKNAIQYIVKERKMRIIIWGSRKINRIKAKEIIEKEIEEILHDKEALLDLENPRRFIFSK